MAPLPQLRNQTLTLIGETMIMSQKLEAVMKAALILLYGGLAAEDRLRKSLKLHKKTLGGLIKDIREHAEIPDKYETTLTRLLTKRNVFIHSLFLQPWFSLTTETGLQAVSSFCHDLLTKQREALVIFLAFSTKATMINRLSETDASTFDTIISRIIETANPYFGDKTPDEYISDFKKELTLKRNS